MIPPYTRGATTFTGLNVPGFTPGWKAEVFINDGCGQAVDNRISESAVGVEALYSSHNTTIIGNYFDVSLEAVGVGFGSNNTIVRNNEIHSLQWGLNLIDVSGSEVSQNRILATEDGINLLRAAVKNSITGNVVSASVGIFLCRTTIGSNRLAPPVNNFRGSDRLIQVCH